MDGDRNKSGKNSGSIGGSGFATSLRPIDWSEGALMSSAPKVLFCELTLRRGEGRAFAYRDVLPQDLPPSHRGKKIKINYHLLVGTQVLNSAVSVLKVPFRVLNTPRPLVQPACISRQDSNDVSAVSPFLRESFSSASYARELPVASSSPPSRSSAGRVPANYNINTTNGCLARLCLQRSCFKLGEEILALLRFPPSTSAAGQCVQFSCALVCMERICEDDSGNNVTKSSSQSKVTSFQDFVYGMEECSLRLEVPFSATPTFQARSCVLSWRLHFEFVVVAKQTKSVLLPADDEESRAEWNAPQQMNVHTLEWDLPITVNPADPLHVGIYARGTAPAAKYKKLVQVGLT